jgi:hypothetical protein
MMRLARRASLLVAFFLLRSAATASAECAWVVWIKYVDLRTRQTLWEPNSDATAVVVDSRESCRKEMLAVRAHITSYDTQSATAINATCFPDTVDPRGPKGK